MKKNLTLITLLAISSLLSQAQWKSEASGFTVPDRGICEMIAVNKNAAWEWRLISLIFSVHQLQNSREQ